MFKIEKLTPLIKELEQMEITLHQLETSLEDTTEVVKVPATLPHYFELRTSKIMMHLPESIEEKLLKDVHAMLTAEVRKLQKNLKKALEKING